MVERRGRESRGGVEETGVERRSDLCLCTVGQDKFLAMIGREWERLGHEKGRGGSGVEEGW